ncbi:MAG: M24 family metallopeptidase [Alphaproteobacteria bacterium]
MQTTKQRLDALRLELKTRGLDGFLVPRADVHQGEEVAPCDERLGWLTGFTGSAGYALVTQDKAYMFTDGRYTLQVKDQCPADLFEHVSLIDTPPSRFVDSSFGLVGYDPWLMTKGQLATYKKANLVAVNADSDTGKLNPIDAIWTDQPTDSTGRIWAHPLKYAGQSTREKTALLVDKLKENSLDTFVFTLPDSIAWLLNIRGSDLSNTPVVRSFLILHVSGKLDWFVDAEKVPQDAMSANLNLKLPNTFETEVQNLKGCAGLDFATCPVALFELVKNNQNLPDPVILLKARKNSAELDGIREAHKRDAKAVTKFLDETSQQVEAGEILTEQQAVDSLRLEREKLPGFISNSFDTISGSGPNGAIVHYRVSPQSDRQLRLGEMYLVDSGGQFVDGTTDITRTLCFGAPTDEMRTNYTLVLKGHIALATANFPSGTTGAALDILARKPLWDHGLDYDHGTGHGVGACLNVHEGPARIAKPTTGSLVPLEVGMILSNEPGYYKAGAYGIRLENLVVVAESSKPSPDGRTFMFFETLSFVRFEEKLIDRGMLTPKELNWLEAYHHKCDEVLAA